MTRTASIQRKTLETDVNITINLDGSGEVSVATGVGFYDHMLTAFGHHGLFDLDIKTEGDLHVDEHHTVEDTALVLGSAIADVLGDRAGIRRYGVATIPMDEAVATAVIDIGGRPYAVIDLPFAAERMGTLGTQMIPHALEAFARTAGCTLHVTATGANDHHIAEAAFKALAYAVRTAVEIDPPKWARLHKRDNVSRIAVIDHGAGNLVSIAQGLSRAGATVDVVDCPADIGNAAGIVLPGVGTTGAAMDRLLAADLVKPLREWGGPLLGICVGLQLFFDHSEEDGTDALGLIDGRVSRLEEAPLLPHIGWNDVTFSPDPLFANVPHDATFYFVHSFAVVPVDASVVVATTEYGKRFVAAARSGNRIGVQFHPERSGAAGLQMLANFVAECERESDAA